MRMNDIRTSAAAHACWCSAGSGCSEYVKMSTGMLGSACVTSVLTLGGFSDPLGLLSLLLDVRKERLDFDFVIRYKRAGAGQNACERVRAADAVEDRPHV